MTFKELLIDWILRAHTYDSHVITESVWGIMQLSGAEHTIIGYIYGWINPLAIVLMVTYLMIGLVKQVSAGHELDTNTLVRMGISIIVADILVANDGWIASRALGIWNILGSDASDVMQAAMASYSEYTDEVMDKAILQQQLTKGSLIMLCVYAVVALMSIVCALLASFAMWMVCYTAKAEFILRVAFAPVGFAGFADVDQKEGARRYLKKLCASALYCMAIIVVVYVVSGLQHGAVVSIIAPHGVDDSGSYTDYNVITLLQQSVFQLIIPFASIGAVSMAKSAINEAFGV